MNTSTPLKVIPLGGLGEIGMNCMILESSEEILIIDCGIMFSDLDHFGVEFVIPDFSYLMERRDKVKGYIFTHGHEDHIGALPFAWKLGIQAPIYASSFTSMLIKKRMEEHGFATDMDLRVFKMGDQFSFKDFKVRTEGVNHSIVDSAALFIDTPYGKIIHTGDFKIDATPFIGKMMNLDAFSQAGDEGVLLLLSDSTNVERHDHSLSESVIYQKFEQLFAAAEGLTVIAMFASNVSRMGQIFDLAKKMKKKVALAGRTMETNSLLAAALGYLKDLPDFLIPIDEIDRFDRRDVIILSSGSQAEYRSSLVRMSNGEHSMVKLGPGDRVLLSSRYIPGNEKAIGRMINQLFKQGADVLYEAIHDIHVSGHATRPELKEMLERVRPKFFIPIHGEYRHLVHHSILAKEAGLKPENVKIAVDGDVMELTKNALQVVDHLEENRVLVEGRDGNDISKLVLKDRRQMGEKGIVFTLLVRNAESRKILSVPEVISRGLASEAIEGFLIEECKKLVRKICDDYEDRVRRGDYSVDLQETIRVELRRFLNQNIGKKPVVLPIILDL